MPIFETTARYFSTNGYSVQEVERGIKALLIELEKSNIRVTTRIGE